MLALALLPATASGIATLVALLAATAVLSYLYATRHFAHWRQKGAPFLKPLPLVGNIVDVVLFRKHFAEFLHETYLNMKSQRYIGIFVYDSPVLFIKDLTIWEHVVHKNFNHFYDKGFTSSTYDNMNGRALFCMKGKPWKDLRVNLSPAFTTAKLKRFYVLINEKAQYLDTFFDDGAKKGLPQEVTNACSRFTTDCVASIGFGIECSSLVDDNSHFRNVLQRSFKYTKSGALKSIAWFARVPLSYHWGSRLVSEEMAEFFRRTVWDTVRDRKERSAVGVRGDYLDHLIELRDTGSIAGDDNSQKEAQGKTTFQLEGDDFVSQAWTFLAAGFETSSTTMSFALYHLAKNQDVQDELRDRLQQALEDNDGVLNYEALQSVAYLEMVILETLRLHPIMPMIDRTCTKAFRIPDSDVVVNEGVVVMCSLLGIHQDPELYPDPERFDPERFSPEEKAKRPPCSFMPFGDGPRICIGMRLGLLLTKSGLAHIILNYRILPSVLTPEKMQYNLNTFLLNPKDGLYLQFKRE